MKKNDEKKLLLERSQQLLKARSEILSLPPEKQLDRLLEHPQPAALVHSFPEEDLLFLIHDIGLQDSLPILSLASDKQKEFFLDMETWEKDRVDTDALTKWLDLMLQADPKRLIKWLIEEKSEFLEFYFRNNIDIRIREHDQDPSDFGDGYFTQDDTVYIKILDASVQTEEQEVSEKERKEFLTKFLNQLSLYDFQTYRNLLIESTAIIATEIEEENYRLRNVRLSEKGFLPFDEAIGIYQPIKTNDLKAKYPKTKWLLDKTTLLPVPMYHAGMLEGDNLFTRALLQVKDDAILQRLQVEFANLSNQIASADQKKITSKEELQEIVKKSCGYLSMGLEKLSLEEGSDRNKEIISTMFIQRYPLADIFRVGFGLAMSLKWQADKWMKSSWFSKEGLTLSFWGEEWLGVLGGLFIKKPLFFDNYKTDQLYREFSSIKDIKETETTLNEIFEVDDLLSLIKIKIDTTFEGFLSFKNLVLTLWVRDCLGNSDELLPVKLADFTNFFEYLFSEKPAETQDEEEGRKIGKSVKESFLNWLSKKTGLPHHKISQKLGQTLENLFTEIEKEYGNISSKDLDPRYVYHFLLEE
ncbi:MAG: hypothetical protein JRJ27_03620 [Deltaproteobacteria bacterium]|nr:hypothetical protein [Deltaproteobacteria bacterium]